MYLFVVIAFVSGILIGWGVQFFPILKLRKKIRQVEGNLESDQLVKETLRRENIHAFQMKESIESVLTQKLKDAEAMIKMMEEDILLLQKNNEETEALLQISQPELHALKIKLIEANNTIARMKSPINAIK